MSDFVIENGVLKEYNGNGGDVVIPDGVTEIGKCSFQYCKSLTSVILPDSMTTIRANAFFECKSLTSITIPNSVTTIGRRAFSECESLTSFTLPNSVTTIGKCAFQYCKSLTSVTIPNSVTNVARSAFYGCTRLTSVTIPNGVTGIGEEAFCGCTSLTSVTISDSVTTIGEGAFSRCTSLTSVTIPDSVTTIGERAFFGCTSLTSVTIPDSVTEIGESTFSECTSLTSVTISKSLLHGYRLSAIFDELERINRKIQENPNETEWHFEDELYYLKRKLESYDIFVGCSNLKELILGKKIYPCNSSVGKEINSILLKIERKNFSELPHNDLSRFFMYGYYQRTQDESVLSYIGDISDFQSEPQFDDIDSEEKFQALMESAMEEDNPSALPPLERFSMYLTSPQVTHYLYLGADKRACQVSMLLWDYMKTDSFILEDYKLTKNNKYVAYIKEHFETFMNTAIEQNDINTVQVFTETGEFFTAENIEPFMHTCLSKRKNNILMILLDYQANQFAE